MTNRNEKLVKAEVLLRHSDSASRDKVIKFLQEKDVEVSNIGMTSISIRCDLSIFEYLFHVSLKKSQKIEPRKGVKDFGSLKHAEFQSEQLIKVPDKISDEVEGVYLQGSPLLF